MLSWIIQITIISIILIFLVHYLFNFFKATLTVPKIKDLVNAPAQKYENMFNIISRNNSTNTSSEESYTEIDLLPNLDTTTSINTNINANINANNSNVIDTDLMKNELKNFLKKQLKETTDISTLNAGTNSNTYSEYNF